MGLQTENIDQAAKTIQALTEKGVSINVNLDDATIKSTGTYLIITGIVTGAVVALFQLIFRKAFG